MRILYVISNPDLDITQNTGYARHILETIKGFELNNNKVKVYQVGGFIKTIQSSSQSKRISFLKKIIPTPIQATIRDILLFKRILKSRLELKKIIIDFNPEIVYERDGYFTCLSSDLAKLGSSWYIEVNAPAIEERQAFSGRSFFRDYTHFLKKNSYSLSLGLFTVSSDLATFLQSKYNVDKKKVIINPNGVDDSHFKPLISNDILGTNYTFGFVGSILPFHGVQELIVAFQDLVIEGLDCSLIIIGDGDELAQLKETVKIRDLAERVTFTGAVMYSKIPEMLKEVSICIMPKSNWYGSPVKIFEYGAMKKPVIAPNVGPVREIITHEYDGILVSNVTELASSMKRLYSDAELCRILGERLYQRVSDNFTWRMNTQRILDTIAKDLMN